MGSLFQQSGLGLLSNEVLEFSNETVYRACLFHMNQAQYVVRQIPARSCTQPVKPFPPLRKWQPNSCGMNEKEICEWQPTTRSPEKERGGKAMALPLVWTWARAH